LVSRRVRRPPPHPPLSLHDALPICAYVWRLADAAQERAEELGMQLHHYYGASLQPEIGADLHRFLDRHPRATGLLLNNEAAAAADRKSTRLNSSHVSSSYAVFCLQK